MTPPDVRVVRGEPDETELAALVAGLAAGRELPHEHGETPSAAERRAAAGRRRWLDASQSLSHPLSPGHDAWRWSARG